LALPGKPVSWTPVAKDGADLSQYFRKSCEAKLQIGAGETYDFEFQPQVSGDLELQASFLMLHNTTHIAVVGATAPGD